MNESKLLAEQLAYYRARAGEYDQWFLREGRYDWGPEHRAEWFREVAVVERRGYARPVRAGMRSSSRAGPGSGHGTWPRAPRG